MRKNTKIEIKYGRKIFVKLIILSIIIFSTILWAVTSTGIVD